MSPRTNGQAAREDVVYSAANRLVAVPLLAAAHELVGAVLRQPAPH
jgi:hypothetical protein